MSPHVGHLHPHMSTRWSSLACLHRHSHTLPDTAPAHEPSVDSRHSGKVAGTIQKPQSQARS